MKSPMPLLQRILHQMGDRCGTSTNRDWETITGRVKTEGFSFVTITLPEFCKDFEEALDLGFVGSHHFLSFRKWRRLPAFLRGFVSQVFDPDTGVLRQDPSVLAIQAVRQICLVFGKINLPCSKERVRKAFDGYLKAEKELREADRARNGDFLQDFARVSRMLWSDLFADIDNDVYAGKIIPKHGPGSTASGLKGNAKFSNRQWTYRLENVFPFVENGFASWSQWQDLPQVRWFGPREEEPVKVISVPKTLKTPRIIAMEPVYMQYVQQGLLEKIEEGYKKHVFPRSFVNHVGTQHVNQELACLGSTDGSLATLDLSEASDRVSNQLVRVMLSPHRWLFQAVDACRSRTAELPDVGKVRLAKFASMGSALTFPFEAMVFCTLVFLGIERDVGHRLSRREILSYSGKVRVYGDDIIVPVEHVRSVIHFLETNGLKVNGRKSFWNGKFRESCGKEYYNGTDVGIVRCRSMLPSSRKDVSELVSTVSLMNRLYSAGLDEAGDFLFTELRKFIRLPRVSRTSQALGLEVDFDFDVDRYNQHLHRGETRVWVVDAKLPNNSIDGYDALLKVFLKRSSRPFQDPRHLEVSGRPVALRIKQQWIPAA
jgi:hypothetical protein